MGLVKDVVKSIKGVVSTAIGGIFGAKVGKIITSVLFSGIFGGVALLLSHKKKNSSTSGSPTYGQATLQTQTNPDLPVPLLYGTVKLAGNRIWQNPTSERNIKRIVAFAEGEITDFTEIKLNDINIKEIAGNKVEKFYGTNDQGLPSMATLDKVGSLRNIAYLYT